MLCDGDQLVDVLRRGQGVLNVLPLAGVKDDIDAQLVPAEPAPTATAPATAPSSRRAAHGRMSLERSPLDAVHRAARRPDGAVRRLGHAARVPDRHDRRAPRLPRATPSCSTCPTSARCGSTGADALDRLQRALTNDLGKIAPGRAQYTHLLDEADGSVLDDIIVWWHPGPTTATTCST